MSRGSLGPRLDDLKWINKTRQAHATSLVRPTLIRCDRVMIELCEGELKPNSVCPQAGKLRCNHMIAALATCV